MCNCSIRKQVCKTAQSHRAPQGDCGYGPMLQIQLINGIIFFNEKNKGLGMVFSSTTFLFLFLPLLFLLYFIRKDIRWRNGVLLVFSLLFYSVGEPVWVVGMIVVTLANWALSLAIHRERQDSVKKMMLALAVVISLVLLVWFKYSAFLVNTVAALAGSQYRMAEQHLPIGISFYTFQVLTYTVDVYRKKAAPQKSFFRTLLYISCFPQLIAGPIVQYADIADALSERKSTPVAFYKGMRRFVIGLSKKVLLANLCGQMLETTQLAGSGADMSFFGAWFSALLYAMQLYFDFSAYSDMAIGLGKIFGFKYKENFNYPYISASITEFWRRWHMSLSGFFRDYVYIPLGGNRKGTGRTILNMAIVWSLTGLWHGASWNFVLWGVYYFILLVVERFVLGKALERIPAVIRHAVTILFVLIGWVIFYYTDFAALTEHFLALFGLSRQNGLHLIPLWNEKLIFALKQYTVLPLLMAAACLPVLPKLQEWFSKSEKRERIGNVLASVAATGLLILSVVFLLGQTYNPFIYFRF